MGKERYKYCAETNQLYDSEEDELYAYNLNNNKVISLLNQQEGEMRELGLINYGDSSYYIQNSDEYEKDRKICELENELAELKQKTIVLKFEPFQKIYVLIYNDSGKCFIVEHTYSGYSVNYCARERIWIQCTDSDKSYMLSSCFATKEEAEQKLAEIKGENSE